MPSASPQLFQTRQRFEAALQAGQSPRIEEFLSGAPADERSRWLRELILGEMEWRRHQGEHLREEDYRQRFPQDAETIRGCFAASGPASQDEERPTRLLERTVAEITLPERLGRYRILQPIRRGERTVVYLARDEELDRQVEVRLSRQGADSTAADLERFRRAARVLAALSHPNLCPIHEVGQYQNVPYLITGHIEGPTLEERLRTGPAFAPRLAAEIVGKLAQVLEVIHRQGIVHRDLTPAAVVLMADDKPVLVEPGLARRLQTDASPLTRDGEVLGSPGYLAPEILRGEPQGQGPPADVFALGVLLHELLTGTPPFGRSLPEVLRQAGGESTPPTRARPEIDSDLDAICRKALAPTIKQRYATMQALADDLGRYLTQPPEEPVAEAPMAPIRQGRRWPWLAGASILAAFALVVLWWPRTPVPIDPDPPLVPQAVAPPLDYDALTRLDGLPLLGDGPMYQASSYDRTGGNNDAGNFLRTEPNGENVLAEAEGPGVVTRLWSTGATGRPDADKACFFFYFDGEEKPRLNLSVADLFGGPGSKYPFVPPLSVTFASGAPGNPLEGPCHLSYVPIPFQKRLKITARYVSFYHVNYRKLPAGQDVNSWTPAWAESQKDKQEQAAERFTKAGANPPVPASAQTSSRNGPVAAGKSLSMTLDGPAVIDALRVKLPAPTPRLLREALLRITFDDARGPSVLTPLGDFFGSGGGDLRFKSLLAGMTSEGYYAYWPMPFARSATVELVNEANEPIQVDRFEATFHPDPDRPANAGYFHACYAQNTDCPPGWDYTILNLKGARGKYVGVNCTMQSTGTAEGIFFLEGDEKIYCDGETWPSRWLGTGTEDYFNGAFFWNHPDKASLVRPLGGPTYLDWQWQRVCAFRWHFPDWVPFRDSIRVDLEHGGQNDVPANYRSVAYYYLDQPHAQKPLPDPAERLLVRRLSGAPSFHGCKVSKVLFKDAEVKMRTFHETEPELDTGKDGHYFARTAVGDTVVATVRVPGEDVYDLQVYLSGGPDYGIVKASLDGKELGRIENNATAFEPWKGHNLPQQRLKAGEHRLELTVIGKTPLARHAHLGLVALHLGPTSRFVGLWNAIGPWPCPDEKAWPRPLPPEQGQDLQATYETAGKKLAWRVASGANHIGLGTGDGQVSYALAHVWNPEERETACFMGRDDALKVWINDVVIFDSGWNHSHLVADSVFTGVKLKKGWNKVLVKSGNLYGGEGFCLRFTDPDKMLKYSREPK